MKTVHDELMENPEFRKLAAIEDLCGGAADLIAQVMQEQNVSKAELARSLKKSRSWVTQLLSGEANMTVRTLAEVLYHLDREVILQTKPFRRGASVKVSGKASLLSGLAKEQPSKGVRNRRRRTTARKPE